MPFLHITTRIPEHPYDKLLSEKGGTGFPTLMFLDAEGRKLLKHQGPRTADGFAASLEEANDFLEQIRKVEAGDKRLAAAVFLRQLENEWFDFEQAQEQFRQLGRIKSKDKKQIEAKLIDVEVRTRIKQAGDDPFQRLAAGEHFVGMWKKKRTPSSASTSYHFWSFIADHAEAKEDKRLFKRAIAGFKDSPAGKSSRYRRFKEELETRLDRL